MNSGILLYALFLAALFLYLFAALKSNTRKHLKQWPVKRSIFWALGIISVLSAVAGPLAERAHSDFTFHMIGHLLLGMLGPLLMVLAAPMTLLLRTLPVQAARQLAKLLKSRYAGFITHPITASLLNIGGLWVLYATDLYHLMLHNHTVHTLVHLHVFLAGYVFTAAFIYIDPVVHRFGYLYRSAVFIIALAGHAILSKYIYVHPPAGIPPGQAKMAGMIMYYGGDVIDAIIIFILCKQWYKARRPRFTPGEPSYSVHRFSE
ncbi:cytochrome c oxidase assembly protein [Siminovitchia sp. 179-K 8D1 HS]|uniref:cytochrome c oxidase assembly protein n=1 Tax=Siminovitchia sp. 179-K 8D1 HS TaxID=3142385 RepID=UPI0039A16003